MQFLRFYRLGRVLSDSEFRRTLRLPNSLGRIRSLGSFVMAAVRAYILKWRLNFTSESNDSSIWFKRFRNLRDRPCLSDLTHQIFGNRLKSLNFVLKVAHEVFHAFTSHARFSSRLCLLRVLVMKISLLKRYWLCYLALFLIVKWFKVALLTNYGAFLDDYIGQLLA